MANSSWSSHSSSHLGFHGPSSYPAQTKGLLEPKSPHDPTYGRIKKVFIAYVHNPDEYEVYIPPYSPEQLFYSPKTLQEAIYEKTKHERQQKMKIQEHTNCVQRLVNYLTSMGVAIVYEEYWKGTHVSNQLQLFEEQINDSDYVLLVITPSMNHYLQRPAPVDEEILFTDNFLYNLMSVKKPVGTDFIPIFLNRRKDVHLVPTSLASSRSYELVEPFDCHSTGDMNDLYRMMTNQRAVFVPSASVVPVPTRKGAFPFAIGQSRNMQPHMDAYRTLSSRHEVIPDERLLDLSHHLADHWQRIATTGLRLTERETKECQLRGNSDAKETCYQILRLWKEKDPTKATFANLAFGLKSADCGGLLKHLI